MQDRIPSIAPTPLERLDRVLRTDVGGSLPFETHLTMGDLPLATALLEPVDVANAHDEVARRFLIGLNVVGDRIGFRERLVSIDLDEDIAELEECTEGWALGLHMAALSVQGRSDLIGREIAREIGTGFQSLAAIVGSGA